jgi:predicted nucleic acid-binding protein
MNAIADTSFVIALESQADQNRKRCLPVFENARFIYLPLSTLNEVCYLLTRLDGNRAVVSFLRRLPRMKYRLVQLEPQDLARTADILDQYADSRIDFVDATIDAVAERLRVTRILTLDQRDFHIIRPKHAPHFELLP